MTACATATPYQPAVSDRYGFEEQRIESNRVRITFRGNSVTDRETVETYLLYRAAELTLQNGQDYFIVANRDTEARAVDRAIPPALRFRLLVLLATPRLEPVVRSVLG